MFGKESKKAGENTVAERNVIGKNTKITGEIVSEGDFRIDGTIEGNIVTNGRVIIGGSGFVNGKVECTSADVEGKFSGELLVTKRCFSSSQLYAMRNQINIQRLIEKNLDIPSRVIKGCFRFLCPLCNGFDTAVNPKTNLARCFSCEKNFNTIDLVMVVRQMNRRDLRPRQRHRNPGGWAYLGRGISGV